MFKEELVIIKNDINDTFVSITDTDNIMLITTTKCIVRLTLNESDILDTLEGYSNEVRIEVLVDGANVCSGSTAKEDRILLLDLVNTCKSIQEVNKTRARKAAVEKFYF